MNLQYDEDIVTKRQLGVIVFYRWCRVMDRATMSMVLEEMLLCP